MGTAPESVLSSHGSISRGESFDWPAATALVVETPRIGSSVDDKASQARLLAIDTRGPTASCSSSAIPSARRTEILKDGCDSRLARRRQREVCAGGSLGELIKAMSTCSW